MHINEHLFLENDWKAPNKLLPWLQHQGSLSKKLEEHAGHAQLKVLNQRWSTSDWWDKYVLNIEPQRVIRRQVLMTAHKVPCWYARSIIPEKTVYHDIDFFNRLEHETLSELIYNSDNLVQRESLVHYAITPSTIEYYWLNESMHQQNNKLWGRLSAFLFNKHYPFYLIEIFLPDLMRWVR